MAPADGSYDLELAAATLRANSSDVAVLLGALSQQLGDTLGDRLRVHRAGRLRKSTTVSGVTIDFGNEQFEATVKGASLSCVIGRVSGGIRIRTENVDVNQWLVRLLDALQREAAHSDAARQALENIVIGGQP